MSRKVSMQGGCMKTTPEKRFSLSTGAFYYRSPEENANRLQAINEYCPVPVRSYGSEEGPRTTSTTGSGGKLPSISEYNSTVMRSYSAKGSRRGPRAMSISEPRQKRRTSYALNFGDPFEEEHLMQRRSLTTMGAVDTDSIIQDLQYNVTTMGDIPNDSLYSESNAEHWPRSADDNVFSDDLRVTGVQDDGEIQESQSFTLNPELVGKFDGYEYVGYSVSTDANLIPPPPLDDDNDDDNDDNTNDDSAKERTSNRNLKPCVDENYVTLPAVTNEQAKEALLQYLTGKCCYGQTALIDTEITKIVSKPASNYRLETYVESRTACWQYEPYTGDEIDDVDCGIPPLPWEIPCEPTHMFADEIKNFEIPFTASVTPCHACSSQGWITCSTCLARGYIVCISCRGTGKLWKTDLNGHRHVEQCWQCHGIGRKKCLSCGRDGRIVCKTCLGYHQLKCYIKMTVNFSNHLVEHFYKSGVPPDNLLRSIEGETVFQQTLPSIAPLSRYPNSEVCETSKQLINDHVTEFQGTHRIIMQRHQLEEIPVSQCHFILNEKEGVFWVYGNQMSVYAPNHALKYCWGCIIL